MKLPTYWRAAVLATCVFVGCEDGHGVATVDAPRALQAASTKPWLTSGLPPTLPARPFTLPLAHPEIVDSVTGGIEGWLFADCVSKADGEPAITSSDELPVGNGRHLECTTSGDLPPATAIQTLLADDGTLYCMLGSAHEYRTEGDPDLTVTLVDSPAEGPWTLRATSEQPLIVRPASFSGGMVWPVWITVHYQTVDLKLWNDKPCEEEF